MQSKQARKSVFHNNLQIRLRVGPGQKYTLFDKILTFVLESVIYTLFDKILTFFLESVYFTKKVDMSSKRRKST